MMSLIQRNLFSINEKIKDVCKIYKKDPARVNLIAVSKKVSAEKIQEAIAHGINFFGENYIQEAEEKWPQIQKENPEIKLHFIGHLQSNKADKAVELFDCVETLDSKKLAQTLKKEAIKQQKNIEVFIQVNIGEESQKGGVMPNEVAELAKFIRDEGVLNLVGLMCIPPADELASPYFALLAKLAKENNLKNLSMGMSADFEDAIALGATHLRIGTRIFGEREKK